MKTALFRFGDWLTKIGERHGVRFLVYNPITWGRFFFSARRAGSIFGSSVREMFPHVKTVVDVGAGSGGYVAKLRDMGFDAMGVEYSPVGRFLGRVQGVKVLPFDCSVKEGMPDLEKADLVYSIEVGEHLPEELADRFVHYIAERADLVIFSAAFPGQGGQGHINEQPKAYWKDKFQTLGFDSSSSEMDAFAEMLVARGYRGWLPKNLQIFRRRAVSQTSAMHA